MSIIYLLSSLLSWCYDSSARFSWLRNYLPVTLFSVVRSNSKECQKLFPLSRNHFLKYNTDVNKRGKLSNGSSMHASRHDELDVQSSASFLVYDGQQRGRNVQFREKDSWWARERKLRRIKVKHKTAACELQQNLHRHVMDEQPKKKKKSSPHLFFK